MLSKDKERVTAISLRKAGLSYNEILTHVPVSKSTLSLWLRDIGLAKKQQQRISEKRRAAQQKAQEACRTQRIERETQIIENSKKAVGQISARELWLIGTSLYWAEGSKQKLNNVSQRVSFGNSDPNMLLLFHRWLLEIVCLNPEAIVYNLYIHRTGDIDRARQFWEKILGYPVSNIYFKNHNPRTNRKNTNENYYGLLRLDIRNSTELNRKIKGWTNGIIESIIVQ